MPISTIISDTTPANEAASSNLQDANHISSSEAMYQLGWGTGEWGKLLHIATDFQKVATPLLECLAEKDADFMVIKVWRGGQYSVGWETDPVQLAQHRRAQALLEKSRQSTQKGS